MNTRPTISLCMIVKDEETYLPLCLESVKGVVDEIVIIDTGSTDSTQTIAKQYGATIYEYEWNNNFADARNYAISKTNGDWLLLLDADEVIEVTDAEKIKDLVAQTLSDGFLFALYNYTGDTAGEEYSIHYAIRLIRNHAGYAYKGSIHEQIIRETEMNNNESYPFETVAIKVHHYGYLTNEIKKHNKRERNRPLIEKELEGDPNNSYLLFMLANEYLSEGNYETGLNHLLKAKENLIGDQAYGPVLYYRIISTLTLLNQFEQALSYADEILAVYPKFTNVIFEKAMIYYYQHRYTLAIDMLNRCIQTGEAPPMLTFMDGTSTDKAYYILGDIYKRLNDHDRAITNYTIAYQYGAHRKELISDLTDVCLKKYNTPSEALHHVLEVAEPDYDCITVLFDHSLYREVVDYVKEHDLKFTDSEQLMLEIKIALFTGQQEVAYKKCRALVFSKLKTTPLESMRTTALKYLFLVGILSHNETLPIIMTLIGYERDKNVAKVYSDLYAIYQKVEPNVLTSEDNARYTLPIALEFLDSLLKLKEFEKFEEYLVILNRIESTRVLIELAKIYDKNGYVSLAQKTLIKSLRDLNIIDGASLDYLAGI